ncbi:RluA family pseudouridine synthase [Campylobacter hyointestinalis]|uniref:RluA family pseudouridine synthase n=1 Tax=Campylobacter hyointestinalis TaxID=198 RepID=UPI000DCE225F|nr:RluA family pseudouridine synthase [Campylobacter hyointestinalis]RAZ61026.1 RluA family pseudouridine synthase [Campylobacter hyointestinalis subsp. lawsonii]
MNEFISSCSGRLDQILSLELKTSRNQISELIKNSNVLVNDKISNKPSFKVLVGDKICFDLPKKVEETAKQKVDFDVEILYEDEDILIVNKPANLVVHPAPSVKEATLVEWLKSKNYTLSTINADVRAGIVHRLDRGTSGVLAVAKNNAAHAALSAQLADKSMGRIYLALSDLSLKENIIVEKPIGRNEQNRLKKAVVSGGRYAKSAFANILDDDGVNLVCAKLFTGRTHQIRVHLASINRHILGDNLYGFKNKIAKINRVMLHAYILNLIHPKSGKKLEFVAALPQDFYEILHTKFNKETINEKINPKFISAIFDDSHQWVCSKLAK